MNLILTRSWLEPTVSSPAISEFRAKAFQAAVAKARELVDCWRAPLKLQKFNLPLLGGMIWLSGEPDTSTPGEASRGWPSWGFFVDGAKAKFFASLWNI